ncbi:MAG: PTS sugar transporter subunit IIB [Pseudobutyrivibrio ruminis]|nr:PTS sugar transporter subunit IIB [Pseudobutyrivibrio ruminis]
MKKILLCCSMGMSTSIVVSAMKKAAAAQGKDYEISATDINSVDEEDETPDVVLVGPQVAHALDQVKELLEGTDAKVAVMNKEDYGSVNGEAILKFAEELAEA